MLIVNVIHSKLKVLDLLKSVFQSESGGELRGETYALRVCVHVCACMNNAYVYAHMCACAVCEVGYAKSRCTKTYMPILAHTCSLHVNVYSNTIFETELY